MDDVTLPAYYVAGRNVDPDRVQIALRITPCQAAIISTPADFTLAAQFAPEVLRADSDTAALQLAKNLSEQTGRPMLVVGDVEFLDAVFADGRREKFVESETIFGVC